MWWKMTQKSGHLERCTTDHLMSQVDVCLLHTKCHLSHKIPPTWVNMQIWKLVINGEHKTGYNTKGCNNFWETILILFEEWYNCVCLILPPVCHPFFGNLFYLARFLQNTITYKSRLTQKKLHKKNDAISSIYGKNGMMPWHFFLVLT